jgi:hypothetical protein
VIEGAIELSVHSSGWLERICMSGCAGMTIVMVEMRCITLSIEIPKDRVEQSEGVGEHKREWIIVMSEERVCEWRGP